MSDTTDSKEQSFQNYVEAQRREANEIFRGLSNEQKIEIQRRFDIAISAGYRAHKLSESLEQEKTASDKLTISKTKSNWVFVVTLIALVIVIYDNKGFFNVNPNLIYLINFPLLYSIFIRHDLFLTKQRINKIDSELRVLTEKWDDVVPNYSIDDFLKWSMSRSSISAINKVWFSSSAIALRRSIIDEVSFKYDFA